MATRPPIPEACHLWRATSLTLGEVARTLEIATTFESENHFEKHLCRCRECGQLYFHLWFEVTDWDQGDDRMHDIYVPVADEGEAQALGKLAPPPVSLDILDYVPRLQSNEQGTMEWLGK